MALLLTVANPITLPLDLLIVFGAAKLLGEIMERLGQPAIVGEIIAGVLIGPSLLNWIVPGPMLALLGDLGVLFLLFRVGLDVKASSLVRVGRTAFLVALIGVIVPFISGWAILRAWGFANLEAAFVGAAMVATSVGITARVLAAKGLLEHRASQIILAAAVIDDIFGLIVLAVVSSAARGKINFLEIALTACLALGFTVLVAVWGTKAMGPLLPRLGNLRAGEAQFNLALILLFGLSVLAVYAGVAAIVGAFLAGMALSETADRRVADLTSGVTEFLVPFFLVGLGLRMDLAVFRSSSSVGLAVVVLLAAVLSKLLGCGLGALGEGPKNILRIGVGMVPRGEVGMVVAQLGLTLGVIQKPVYGIVVFMAVASTMIAPPLLKFAFRGAEASAAEERYSLG